jgi:hypothetical protein
VYVSPSQAPRQNRDVKVSDAWGCLALVKLFWVHADYRSKNEARLTPSELFNDILMSGYI